MQETSQNLKYSIKNKMLKLPGTFRQNTYKAAIELDISLQTLNKWMGLKKGDKYSIPTDQFYLLASFLDCNPIDLING